MSSGTRVVGRRATQGGASELTSPSVGIFRPSVSEGDLVAPGQSIGTIEVLGIRMVLLVPEGAAGAVSQRIGAPLTRVPVQHGDVLVALSASSMAKQASITPGEARRDEADAVFVAPMSGRYYSRPSPEDPPFVAAGTTVTRGQTVGLLEVMKTFNRLVYQDDSLPNEAIVEHIVPSDGDDVVRGDPILHLRASIEE